MNLCHPRCALLALCALLYFSTGVAQTDTTFTYQGVLSESGQPANGDFTMAFGLWTAAEGGSQLGSHIELSPVPVTDGNFTVQLDFGAARFTGANRWLRIVVNGQDLAPRQLITHTPYSIQTRGIFVADNGRVGIGTTTPAADFEVDGSTSNETGLYVRAPGGATGDLTISSPAGEVGMIALANGGNRRDIRFTDQGIALLTSSAPTIPGGANGIIIEQNADVGMGILDPRARLHVADGASGLLDFGRTVIIESATTAHLQLLAGNTSLISFKNADGDTAGIQLGSFGDDLTFGTSGVARLTIRGDGDVGIRNENPAHPFQVGSNSSAGSGLGAHVTGSGVWTNGSDRNMKEDFRAVDHETLLERLVSMPVTQWRYKGEPEEVSHIGPVAQDFRDAFGLGESDRYIGTVDADGVALAAIQALYAQLQEKQAQIDALAERLECLETDLNQGLFTLRESSCRGPFPLAGKAERAWLNRP